MITEDLRYILESGTTVYTQSFSDDEWVPNVIKNVTETSVVLNLSDYYFRQGTMVGDFMSVRFSYNEKEYVLEGEISDIDIYNSYTISIFINNVNVYVNRRKHFRYYSKLGANLKLNDGDKGTYSILTNISYSGIALISKATANIGSPVSVDLFLSTKNIISLKGTIARKKALNYGYEYGITIQALSEESTDKFKKLISKLDSDQF